MPRLSVVLDTNILVSGLLSRGGVPGRLLAVWRHGGLNVVLSHYILNELARVLPRLPNPPFSPLEIRDLIDSFVFMADMVEPDQQLDPDLRDAGDQPVLATLRAANANYLITGDKDLLALSPVYPVITPSAFWARHGG